MLTPRSLRERVRAMAGGLPRPFWVLWTGTLINRMGLFVLPFLTLYLTRERGFSIPQAGLVAALYGAGGATAGPLGGYVADHAGRRFTMVLALTLGGAGMIALGFARGFGVIATGAFLIALVSEMYRPAMQAALSELVPGADRARAFGLIYWAINLGVSIGLTLAGQLASHSFLLLFLGDGATTLLYALLIARGVPETLHAHAAATGHPPRVAGDFFVAYRDRTYVAFLVLAFFTALVFLQHMTTMPLAMTERGISRAAYGVVIALNGLVIVFVQPFLGPLLGRLDRSRVLAGGALLLGLGYGLNALATTAPAFAVGVVVWTLGEIAVLPLAYTVIAELSPRNVQGRYQGAYTFAFGLAACAAPMAGSQALAHFGAVALWCGCLGVGVLICLGHLALRPALTRAREARAAAEAAATAAAH